MDENKLSDFERAEYYRNKYEKRKVYTVLIALLCFAIGYALAKYVDGMNPIINNIAH